MVLGGVQFLMSEVPLQDPTGGLCPGLKGHRENPPSGYLDPPRWLMGTRRKKHTSEAGLSVLRRAHRPEAGLQGYLAHKKPPTPPGLP